MKIPEKELEYCTTCPKLCRFACPVANAEYRESTTPWGKVSMLYYLTREYAPHTSENYDLMYHCTTCLACREFCEHKISVPDLLIMGRNMAYDKSRHHRGLDRTLKNIKKYGSVFGEDLRERLSSEFDPIYFSRSIKVLLFVGCVYTRHQFDTIKKAIFILERLGIDYAGIYNREQFCCGLPLYSFGFLSEFSEYAEMVKKNLSGIKKVIALCPSCTYTLKSIYPQFDNAIRAEVLTFSEFILPFIKNGLRDLKKICEHYAYHDPCYMSRYLNQTEEPRELLKSTGGILSELLWNRKNSICCGAGGMHKATNPDTTRDIAARRLEEFKASGAKKLVTSCPTCLKTFKDTDPYLPVVDIIEVVYEFLRQK